MMRQLLLLFCAGFAFAQTPEPLGYGEFLGYVKKYHPMVRQANLEITAAEAALMAARGGFDPKIEVDYASKEFKGTEYYSLLNSSFKIPTWYGVEFKAGFDNAEGMYVNPEHVTPNSGLTSFGVSVPLGQGLFINQRMADVRSAKAMLLLGQAERNLRAAAAIYEASKAYFHWKRCYDEAELYKTYLDVAQTRFIGIRKLIEAGDKPAIDSVEAGIIVKNRRLSFNESQLKLTKARLDLSNFLWIEQVPVVLAENVVPETSIETSVVDALGLASSLTAAPSVDNHPKITALQSKQDVLDIERRLKANMLLPRIDASYNYLSEPSYIDNYRFEDYKIGLNVSFPLFLRKERGGLKLAKAKLEDNRLELAQQRLELRNKITAQQAEIALVAGQKETVADLVKDYSRMLESEERLFSVGESSVFLINSRENSLVSARLSQIDMDNRYLMSYAELYKTLGAPGL